MRFTDARALLFSIANELQRPSLALIRWSESLNQVIYNHLLLFVLVHKNKFNESAMDVWLDQHHYISVRFIVVGWEASGRDTGLLRTPSTDGQDYQHFLCFFFDFFHERKEKRNPKLLRCCCCYFCCCCLSEGYYYESKLSAPLHKRPPTVS